MKYHIFFISAVLIGVFAVPQAYADHSWGGYHWARTANPFTLRIGDNVSTVWDAYLQTTATDWSASTVLDTVVGVGTARSRTCRPTQGKVEVCNYKYGANGWLGIAQIWVSGGHITQGVVKMNDTYFTTAAYNTSAWRNLVMCQEVGHTLGLDHQDENFDNTNLNTCMDYTDVPQSNQHPNTHDYEMLESLYAHLDGVSTVLGVAPGSILAGIREGVRPMDVRESVDVSDPSAWGKVVREDARNNASVYKRTLDSGDAVYTFVTWVDGHSHGE